VKYYPAFLDLKDKKAVILGGGKVAERKVRLLIQAGASVTLVSPDITGNIRKLVNRGLLQHVERTYRKGDLKNAFIVIAGTSSSVINKKIAQDARHLLNVVDMPTEGNYIVPSILKRGPLTIAISTEGSSPAISRAIRKELERYYSSDFALYLKFVERIRKKAMKDFANAKRREKFLKSLASYDLLNILRSKGFGAVRKIIESSLNKNS
jgi:precorrin-2 dehydrogenase/sirohydrochlorin ferrochelatase